MASSPRCRICQHDDRAAIETAILAGKSRLSIARTFHLGSVRQKDGVFRPDHKIVQRHIDGCMPDAYQRAMDETKVAHGQQIAARLKHLDDVVDEVLEEARKGYPMTSEDGTPLLNPDGSQVVRRDGRMILAAVKEARANADMLARLSGAAPDETEAAAEAARRALESPEVRKMLTDVEAMLAKGG